MLQKFLSVVTALTLLVLSFCLFANSMTKQASRDEQMYCTAGVLMAQGQTVYKDFSYVAQLPYHPLLYSVLFKFMDTKYYLFTGRAVSVLCDIGVMVCILVIYRRVFSQYSSSGVLLGLTGVLLYVFNPLVDYTNGYAWNHDVVVLCVMLSFLLFISVDFACRYKYLRIAAMGALLTLASCMRVTTALVELLFFIAFLTQPAASARERLRNILPFVLAMTVVLIWPIWLIVKTPQAFFLNVVRMPMLNSKWLHDMGIAHNKLGLLFTYASKPGYFVLIVIAVYLCVVFYRHCRKLTVCPLGNMILATLLPLVLFIVAFLPPTMWRQYLAVPVPFIIVGFVYPLASLKRLADESHSGKHFKRAFGIIVSCALLAVLFRPVVLSRMSVILVPARWVPLKQHKAAIDIVQKTKEPKRILTLAPLLVLEGGGKIYTELSAESIAYRFADFMSPAEQSVTHTVGPDSLAELIRKSPPSAVILGVEPWRFSFLEERLRAVVKSDWKMVPYRSNLEVYFRP